MELFVIIVAWLVLRHYLKSDPDTKEKYKQKAREAYNRIVIETQKAGSKYGANNYTGSYNSSGKVDEKPWQNIVTDYDRKNPVQIYSKDRKAYVDQSDGPTVQRSFRMFGPRYED